MSPSETVFEVVAAPSQGKRYWLWSFVMSSHPIHFVVTGPFESEERRLVSSEDDIEVQVVGVFTTVSCV